MMDNPNNTSKISIFQTLKYAGENFFANKETLQNVRTKCDDVCKIYHQNFIKIQPVGVENHVDDILFHDLNIKQVNDINCEKRRKCSPQEEKLILDSCQNTTNPEDYAEHIKYSLGFLAKGYVSTFKKPCVAVVGQTKAGKSSLINCILQARVVPQKVSRQTARVTYVTHCPIKFVAHMKDSILKKIEVNVDIKSEDVDLQFEERNKREEVNVEIRIGTTNPIIQNGFDIVDSPGLNENPSLNELCAKMERSLLPLLIYVVEGRNGLTQTDIDDIKNIRSSTPQLTILYFVTKLQRSKFDRLAYMDMKEKKGFAKNEDMPGESDVEVIERRLNKVLTKLKQNGFVAPSVTIGGSKDFHGADIWIVNEMRIHEPGVSRSDGDLFNLKLMDHFEQKLMIYLKENLENPLKEDIQYIQASLEKVLEKATSIASEIASERKEKKVSLGQFELCEKELYEKELEYIKNILKTQIDEMIGKNKKRFIQLIVDMEYANDITRYKNNPQRYNAALSHRRNEIRETIEKSLNEEIKEFIKTFMLSKEERLKEKLRKIVKKLSAGKFGSSSFETMLTNRLFYEYEFYEECSLGDSQEFAVQPKSKRRIEELIRTFGNLACGFFKVPSSDENDENVKDNSTKEDPNDPVWKENVANKVLNQFDRNKFLEKICKLVTDEFTKRHENFANELEDQGAFLQDNLNIGHEQKQCVREFAEKLAAQFAVTLHVRTPLYIMVDPLRDKIVCAEGGQGWIEKAFLIGKNEPIAIKSYKQKFLNFDSEKLLKIGMEIYYSSRLNSPYILKLMGIHFEETPDGFVFSAYYPFQKLGSLRSFLDKHGSNISLDLRLKFSVDIAQGLQTLHKLQIVHRDVNLKNILVRESADNKTHDAIICDFGLSKSFGFIECSERIGTLLYIAPEFFKKNQLKKEGYSCAVDVFSFGISLWQLISYKLDGKYLRYYPQFVIDCEQNPETIEKMVIDNVRPESRDNIPPQLMELMQKCWSGKPTRRPSFIKTMSELSVDCSDDDFMKDKTITDVLIEIKNDL